MYHDDQSHIEEIIYKSFFSELSEEEEVALDAWLNQSEKNRKVFKHVGEAVRTRYQEPSYINASSMKSEILARGFVQERGQVGFAIPWLKIAALVVISFALGLTYFILTTHAPETKKVLVEMEEKINPPGVKSRIVLSDNSVVWLNADSKLTYNKEFSDTLRYLVLEGEAYFEVSEDKTRPFIVQSGSVKTRALGTSFNIRHYRDDKPTEVALLTGKVSVSVGSDQAGYDVRYLNPYEKLSVSKDASVITKGNLNSNKVSSWKDNILFFENADFAEVVASLERWYGVEIDAKAYSKRKWNYNSEFRNQSLELVLKRIGFSQNFQFEIQDKHIRIYDANL